MTIYYDEASFKIIWDAELQAVIAQPTAFVFGSPYRLGLEKGLELVVQNKSSRWLADLRKARRVEAEDQKWVDEDWFPRVVQAGIKWAAIVVAEDVRVKMQWDKFLAEQVRIGKNKVNIVYFRNIEEARQWLKSPTILKKQSDFCD